MKKLMVFSVILALLAGSVFAVDLDGTVFGRVNIVEGDNIENSEFTASGGMGRIRIDGSGESDDGTFGGYIRIGDEWCGPFHGNAWWKPIDQLLIRIGGNGGDGFWSQDGNTRWMFYRVAGDVGIASEGWAFGNSFYQGFAGYGGPGGGLMLEITPTDMIAINIGVPFIGTGGGLAGLDVYRYTNAQLALNLDFGTIAISFAGGKHKLEANEMPDPADYGGGTTDPDYLADLADYFNAPFTSDAAKAWLYFGLRSIENLEIDVGVGFPVPVKGEKDTPYEKVTVQEPISAGLGVKFDADAFSIRARVQGSFGGNYNLDGDNKLKMPLVVDFDLLPCYAVSDTLRIYASIGLKLTSPADNKDVTGLEKGDAVVGFHFNPWVEVGGDWGPRFYAGIDVRADGSEWKPDSKLITYKVPIAIGLSF